MLGAPALHDIVDNFPKVRLMPSQIEKDVLSIYLFREKTPLLYKPFSENFMTLDQENEMANIYGFIKSISSTAPRFFDSDENANIFHVIMDKFTVNVYIMGDYSLAIASEHKIVIDILLRTFLGKELLNIEDGNKDDYTRVILQTIQESYIK